MYHNTDRILTTHIGSLPRPPELVDLFDRRQAGTEVATDEFETAVLDATRAAIQRQHDVGIDLANNGEQSRAAFNFYLASRLSGFEGETPAPQWADLTDYPEYARKVFATLETDVQTRPAASEPIEYPDLSAARNEVETFFELLDEQEVDFEGTFVTAASPGIVATSFGNEHYDSHEEYVFAVAEALQREYELIAESDAVLQIDAPDLLSDAHRSFHDASLEEFKETVRVHVEAINRATSSIPDEQIRMHTCWGNYEGPHHRDVPLEEILPEIYEADVGGLCVEQANPRHQHEYRAFEAHPLPEDMTLIPGVIDVKTNVIEHPRVVADRIEQFADAVGDPTRVIAAPDCGFGTIAGLRTVDSEIAWAKLQSLVDGAALATERLF